MVEQPLRGVLLPDPGPDFTDWEGRTQLVGMVDIGFQVIALALALIVVTQIARSGVVRQPWNLAPLWALGVVVAMRVLGMVLLMLPAMADYADAANAMLSLVGFLVVCAAGFLGVLAIVLASRPVPGSERVFSSQG